MQITIDPPNNAMTITLSPANARRIAGMLTEAVTLGANSGDDDPGLSDFACQAFTQALWHAAIAIEAEQPRPTGQPGAGTS